MNKRTNIAKRLAGLFSPFGGVRGGSLLSLWGRLGGGLLLLACTFFAQAQDIGGSELPIINSTHDYYVEMGDAANNTPFWYIYEKETDIFNIDERTPRFELGSGSIALDTALIEVFFSGLVYALNDTITLVYKEIEPSSLTCVNYRFYNIIIMPLFDIDINTADFPGNVCPFESNEFIRNPVGNLSYSATYEVMFVSPEDYAFNWNFSYSIATSAQRPGYSDAVIDTVTITATSGFTTSKLYPDVSEYEDFVSDISVDVDTIRLNVDYSFPAGSAQSILFTIMNLEGEFKEQDDEDPQSKQHQINELPAPSAITAVD